MNIVEDVEFLKGTPGYWYLASPYTKFPGGIDRAFVHVCRHAGRLIAQGVNVYSPIAHTHPIAVHAEMDALDHNIWLPADQPLMEGATGMIVLMMRTWEDSKGVQYEIAAFEKMGKPIYYLRA